MIGSMLRPSKRFVVRIKRRLPVPEPFEFDENDNLLLYVNGISFIIFQLSITYFFIFLSG